MVQSPEQKPTYRGVAWNEPIIYELSKRGRRGCAVPTIDPEIERVAGDVLSKIPNEARRKTATGLPELSEPEVVRHFIHLSQQNYGTDSGNCVGVGTCTMKYNPKLNEALARSAKLSGIHPFQDVETVQGILEIMFRLGRWLCEISGMDDVSLHPRAGAHAVLTNARIIRKYHEFNGELDQRDEIITTVLSHPSNGAAPAVAGFKVITLYPDETGTPSLEALKSVVSRHTAGIMITDPYDTGVFDRNIEEYIRIVHEIGGLAAIDQANANSILGRLRIGDVGADLCHFNLHKSFSTPHGSSGPGSAPICAKKQLSRFLPVPAVAYDGAKYFLDYNRPDTIGKTASFYGVIPNLVRAYAWIMTMGADGLRETSEVAVINNNYLIQKVLKIRGITLPWREHYPRRMQEARFSLQRMEEETGIGVDALNRRIVDLGVQKCFTAHHPPLVPEPLTPEPVESNSKEDIDQFVDAIQRISDEAYSNPKLVEDAPHNCAISQIDASAATDPKKWAMTWRAYLRKNKRVS
jgi:glycine dehydrogenase subunit 2